MLLLGIISIVAGALLIVAALFVSEGTAALLGIDMSAMAIFFVGVASGALILWGISLTRLGARRELRARREHRQLAELSEKLERVEGDRDRKFETDPNA